MLAHDRKEAGKKLVQKLQNADLALDNVLAIASGGVVVGREIARHLELEMDMMAVEDIRAPDMPDVTVGSVTYDGTLALKDGVIEGLGVSPKYIEQARIASKREALRFFNLYSSRSKIGSLTGRTVLVVDDGSTGESGVIASIGHVKKRGAEKVIVATPVTERTAYERLGEVADQVIVLEKSMTDYELSDMYGSFEWVSESDLKRYIGS